MDGQFASVGSSRHCERAPVAARATGTRGSGEDVGEKLVAFMDEHRDVPVEWSHERAGFDLGDTTEMDYL
ncbi:hypothetical protein [Halorubellus litoreus]|uniref:Transposase n=1 Tax=Halorubellus litoreus TaxID=755308 RepID=A0ABD5VI82_9EURY